MTDASTIGREFNDAKNDSLAQFDKTEFGDTTDNQDLTEVSFYVLFFYSLGKFLFGLRWKDNIRISSQFFRSDCVMIITCALYEVNVTTLSTPVHFIFE